MTNRMANSVHPDETAHCDLFRRRQIGDIFLKFPRKKKDSKLLAKNNIYQKIKKKKKKQDQANCLQGNNLHEK